MKFLRNYKTVFILSFLLIFSIAGSLCFRALNDFYTYKDTLKMDIPLNYERFLFFFKKELKYEWNKLEAPPPLKDFQSPLLTFKITVKQKDLDSLNKDLPKSGKDHYIDAYLKTSMDKKIRKVKLKYRGDNNFHWLYPQKSFRIKLAKKDIFNMELKFNLINPPNWYSFRDVVVYDFAKQNSLMAPDFFPARVYINGKYMGVYLYLSQVDESLLRKFKRMPGSVYFGDYGEPDKRGVSNLWFDANNWTKKAARNAEQKYDRSDINYFINAVNNFNDREFYDFFNTMTDKKKFYAFFALDVIFGSDHHDYHHNHKIYFDPYLGKYEPIEWDLRVWSDEKIKDLSVYPLLNRVRLNPILEAQRDKYAYDILKKLDFSPSLLLKKYEDVIKKIKRDLKSDYLRDTAVLDPKISDKWVSTSFTMDEFYKGVKEDERILKRRFDYLKEVYNDAKISYKTEDSKIIFKVWGNSPVTVWLNGQKKILYPGRKILKNAQNSRPKLLYGADIIVNAPLYYTFDIKDIKNLKAYNYITGKEVKLKKEDFKIAKESDSCEPAFCQTSSNLPKITLKGVIDINETKVFHNPVVVKEGTVFRLNSKKSIYFYGDLKIKGTKEKPVIFKPLFKAKPWGIVGIWSKNAKLSFVKVEGGSVDERKLVHFTAPLSFHNVKNLKADHLKILKNYTGDDAMHIAYSKGDIKESLFQNARSDGLDIDISNISIKECKFITSGNDGLDVMTTDINVSSCEFVQNGDKGISVGEWSNMSVSDSLFVENYIGLEIKDKSKVKAKNLTIINSKDMAIHLYNKNKRYDEGGFLEAENIALSGNKKVKKDKKSFIKISFANTVKSCFQKTRFPDEEEKKGHLFFAKKEYQKALVCFKKALEFTDKDDNKTLSKRYRYYANTLMLLDRKDEAVKNFALSLKYDKTNKNAFYPLKEFFSSFKDDKKLYQYLLDFETEILEVLFDNKVIKKRIFYFNTYEDHWSRGKRAKVVIFWDKEELKRVKFFLLNKANVVIDQDKKPILRSFINTSEAQFAYIKLKKGFSEIEFKSDRVCIPKVCGFNEDRRELGIHIDIESLTKGEKEEFQKGIRYFYVNYYDDHWAKGKRSGVWINSDKTGGRIFLRFTANDLSKEPFFVTVYKNFRFYAKVKLKPNEVRFEEIGLDQGINFIELKSEKSFRSKVKGKPREISLKYKLLTKKDR